MFRAGLAADACARFEQAEELFAEASELTSDHELRADAVARRSYLVFNRGDFDAAIELANSEAAISSLHVLCDHSNDDIIDIVTAYIPQKPWWQTERKRTNSVRALMRGPCTECGGSLLTRSGKPDRNPGMSR